MIKQFKTNIATAVVAFALAASLPSCKNDEFFNIPDRGGIDAAIWDNEGSVQLHLNRVYDVAIPNFPVQLMPDRTDIQLASDESYFPDASNATWARTALGLTGSTVLGNNDVRWTGNTYGYNPGNNKYFDIQRCNDAIQNIPLGSMPEATKRALLGQYYALRAMTYLELVKVYGGVPLPTEKQGADNFYLGGRKSARECFALIESDLNKAIDMLPDSWPDATGRGKISKLVATCLKARVLLYWASPQFNPLNDPKHPFDQTRWQKALDANKAAYDACLAAGKKLMTNYADIFRVEGTANTEAILVRPASGSIANRGHDAERRSRPQSEGGSPNLFYQATIKMLESYPMKDGLPRGTSAQFSYDNTMFWLNRDPRFEATIAYNGSTWPLSGVANRRQWTYNNAVGETNGWGVYCKRFTTPALTAASVPYSSGLGGSGMDWIELRFAEVMLNYADCLNETGNLGLAKEMVRQIRVRAGIVAGTSDYGLGLATTKEQMRTLIIGERQIEFAFEGKRNSDLRRTRTMHLLSGPMQRLEVQLQKPPVGTVLNDKGVLEAPVSPGSTTLFRETLTFNTIADKPTYEKYFKHVVIQNATYSSYNIPEFHYFYTFHNDFVNNGQNIEPTIGWTNGTFDPLDN